ncbi:MAG: P22 phage major capsid protein family protein [bacterium]|nr:P22 phage major capsid protein family protein [bacterium]
MNNLQKMMLMILARGLPVLRSKTMMPLLVRTDFEQEVKQKGDTINFALPGTRTVGDVVPGPTSPAPEASTSETVPLVLNHWKQANWGMTDKEMGEIEANKDFVPLRMQEAFEAMGQYINSAVLANYKGVYGFAGTPGTTPFATNANEIINARKVLAQQRAPMESRRCIIDADAEANALALSAFQNVAESGDIGTKREGQIGRKFGFDFFYDDNVPSHTAGNLSDGTAHRALLNGAVAVGAKTMDLDATSLTGTVEPGDVFSVAGDSQTYSITNTSTQTAAANALAGLTFEPAAKVAWADNAQVTFKDSHKVNLAFHQDAFALAFRMPDQGLKELDSVEKLESVILIDPVTKIPVRLEKIRQYKQIRWEIDVLFGTALLRPELACRIAG